MKLYYSSTLLLLLSRTATAAITGQQCIDQGGQVVGDIGDGAIFQAGYTCENSGAAPTDQVIASEVSDGKAFAADGQVCCGGTGQGIASATGGSTFGDLPEGNAEECTVDSDCPAINCIVAPCPAAVCVEGVCGIEEDPPNPECVQDSDCPVINCFVAPCDDNVCNGGLCELQPAAESEVGGLPTNDVMAERMELSRTECIKDYQGTVVGDIGNGAIHSPDYICDSNGLPPIGTVVPQEGEPIAIEGEVCCGPPVAILELSRKECVEQYEGTVVGDIGNGAIHSPDYICESNGQPPLGPVMAGEGQPIAIEGEVCCGPADTLMEVATNTTAPVATDDPTPAPQPPVTDGQEDNSTSGAGRLLAVGVATTAIVFGFLF